MAEVAKGGQMVPESVLKKQKRNEEWALAKKQEIEELKKKNAANRKLIFNRAKQYSKEYEAQVSTYYWILVFDPPFPCFIGFDCFPKLTSKVICLMQDKELIQLKREARLKGGFYVNPEAKMLFIIRIRGYVC